ncbi:MAG: aminotransferase class V-fold PLP-dependent enzyme [Planctomycetota bacterium]
MASAHKSARSDPQRATSLATHGTAGLQPSPPHPARLYLDNASTSWPKPPRVLEAMTRYFEEIGASPGRAAHRAAVEAERIVADVRRKLTDLFEGDDPQRMIFCHNCTDALNMAIKGSLRQGDHVVTTMLEHNSVSRPLQRMADEDFIELTCVPADASGFVDPDAIAAAIRPSTRLITCVHAGNVVGTIQPIEAIGRLARSREVLFLVDAAQSAGLVPISVERMNIDLLAFPGHKALLGPPGTGGLYVGRRASLRPWREGGTGGDSATPTQPQEYPFFLEAGTPNTVGVVGLGAALEVLDPAGALAHEREMVGRLIAGIAEHGQVRLVGDGSPSARVGTVSVVIDGLSPEQAAGVLDESFGIAARAGLHCAPYAHRALGTFPEGTLRISPGPMTTSREIDLLVEALGQISA